MRCDAQVVWSKEVDKDGVVTIDGLENPPWKTLNETELRTFLLERAKEGYSFPINPVRQHGQSRQSRQRKRQRPPAA
jgi:hypothetical protein